jgi:hypothetical protein
MCVDYTDLNKHYPKDPFGLPRIDQVIDSTAGCDLLCFHDCYSGYHQIAIKEEDQEKTTFITPLGAYCYTTMSFGLNNAGSTYHRAIQACFKRQLNRNVEAYVDDVVVKTRNSSTLIDDLEETFASLREYPLIEDRNVKERSFNIGDLVLRRIQNTKGLHKLSSPWEGPFTVAKVTRPGSYRLQTHEGEDVNNSWNVDQLCRFYA